MIDKMSSGGSLFCMARLLKGKEEEAKKALEKKSFPYYMPSEDNTLSFSFKYIFQLQNLKGLIFISADSFAANLQEMEPKLPLDFLHSSARKIPSFITDMQYRLFQFVIHRETPGIILEAHGIKQVKKTKIRITGGTFKGFEGVLPVDPADGYALVLELPPLFSWQIPVDKQYIQICHERNH